MPPKRYRVFSREFKEAAVRRVLAGEKVRVVATDLQIVPKLLYHWWHQYEAGGVERLRPAGRPPSCRTATRLRSQDVGTTRGSSPSAPPFRPVADCVHSPARVGRRNDYNATGA